MERERPEGSFLYGQSGAEIEAELPTRKEKVSAASLRSFICAAFLGSVLGIAAWQAVEHNQAHAQQPINQPAVTSTLEPPCADFGDVDRDEGVTPRDAILILQNEARLLKFPFDQEAIQRGDVTDDSQTNALDALTILHYVVGNINTFPACRIIPIPISSLVPTPGYIPERITHDYLDMDMAVFYYGLDDNQARKVRNALDRVREFYWRNTCMNVNINTELFEITEVVGGSSISDQTLVHTLGKNGRTIDDFDIKYHIGNDVGGVGWSWGINSPFNKGFSHQRYQEVGGFPYPENDPDVNYHVVRLAFHENLHVLDAMADAVGYPEIWHPDQEVVFAEREGLSYSYEAGLLRNFFCNAGSDQIQAIATRWGEIKYFDDHNGNGLPDAREGGLLGSDEKLGPGWNIQRYTESIYGTENENSNLRSSFIVRYVPTIDGRLEQGWGKIADGVSWNGIDINSDIYAAWTEGYLFIGGTADKDATLEIDVDADADGIWNGRYNLNISFHYPSNFLFNPFGIDSTDAAREFACQQQNPPYSQTLEDGLCEEVSDNNLAYVERFGEIIRDEDAIAVSRLDRQTGRYFVELRIPIGYPLVEGSEIGLKIDFDDGRSSTVFPPHEL